MKKSFAYYLLFFLCIIFLHACKQRGSELPSLKETYSKTDKNPFGTYVFFKQATQMFKNNDIRIRKDKLQTNLYHFDDTGALYINISKNYFIGEEGIIAAKEFVSKGNSMFIASENIDSSFLNTLGVSLVADLYAKFMQNMQYTAVQLNAVFFKDTTRYSYYYLPFSNHFTKIADSSVKILGRDANGNPNFVLKFYGKGRFYIHCDPRAFSNYFLLQKNNYKYLELALAFVPEEPEHVIWDNYYNKIKTAAAAENSKSGLAVLLMYPAMAWGFGLLVLLLLLYLFFGSKRQQRIIAPLPANVNTSVTFADTISRLYLQQKDNKRIAEKMITYFFEHIRTHYFINTSQINEQFIATLSRKTNRTFEDTEKLFHNIRTVQDLEKISDQQLLLLNQQIELFNKNKL